MSGNNTLFRIGTQSGWCTRTHLLGSRVAPGVAAVFGKRAAGIEETRDALSSVLETSPPPVLFALWFMGQLKLAPVAVLKCPSTDMIVSKAGFNRITAIWGSHGFELRLKRKGRNDLDIDVLVERAW